MDEIKNKKNKLMDDIKNKKIQLKKYNKPCPSKF